MLTKYVRRKLGRNQCVARPPTEPFLPLRPRGPSPPAKCRTQRVLKIEAKLYKGRIFSDRDDCAKYLPCIKRGINQKGISALLDFLNLLMWMRPTESEDHFQNILSNHGSHSAENGAACKGVWTRTDRMST